MQRPVSIILKIIQNQLFKGNEDTLDIFAFHLISGEWIKYIASILKIILK